MVTEASPFWKIKTLDDMSFEEWELLCDGCGRCCLHKLEDVDTGVYFYTNVACRFLDNNTCRCRNYLQRKSLVDECVQLSNYASNQYDWLPVTCAYRRLAEGKDLEWWHPLISGNPETVHEAHISIRGRTINEGTVSREQLEDHIIDWIDF
jgi:uncharacterized cysteine cluster protein YcgN (CxxCxxCC family)